MVMITTVKPDDVVPLRGQAGARYELLAEDELSRAATYDTWITLSMRGGSSRVAISSIGNIRPCSEGDVHLSFTCRDVAGTAYYGWVTRGGYTTFGRVF